MDVEGSGLCFLFSGNTHLSVRTEKSTREATANLTTFLVAIKVLCFLNNVTCRITVTVDLPFGRVVRVLGYRSGDPGSIPGTTRKKSSGSGTGSTQPREYN
jgi:hypothetical protein